MWALTLAQVPATLVGYETPNEAGVRLLDEKMVDVVLVLLVATSILGPLIVHAMADQARGEHKGCAHGVGTKGA